MKLVDAIISHEGWIPANKAADFEGSRSWRNNNPGNLRSSPFSIDISDGYAVFQTEEIGRQALIWDLKKKSLGETATNLTGFSTLKELIEVYAPASDGNDPDKYLIAVMQKSGLSGDEKIGEIFVDTELPEIKKEEEQNKGYAKAEEKEKEAPAEKKNKTFTLEGKKFSMTISYKE